MHLDWIADNQETYTIFVAENSALFFLIPQDVGNPIYSDSKLRRDVLLGHIVRGRLSSDDLVQQSVVVMANNQTVQISREADVTKINEATVSESIRLQSLGNIFIVDRYFVDRERITESIRKRPQKFGPLGSPLIPNN